MDIKIFSLSNYVRPKVKEIPSRGYVLNGHKNSFYDYILDRNNGSPTNAAINNTYIDMIYGKGLTAKDANKNMPDWLKFKTVLRPKDLRRIVADFQIFGEASIQVIKTKGGELSSIKHVAKEKTVPSIVNDKNEIESYFVSDNWSNIIASPPEEFKAFGTSKDAIEIYVIQPYKAGKVYFSDPDYLAALSYAEMEEEIANLNINSIKNGLSAGYIINIPGGLDYTAEQKEDFELKVRQKLTGSTNASNFILSFNGRDVSIEITPFPTNDNIHKQWQFLTTEALRQIATGHRLPSTVLVGVSHPSGFSSTADEMETAQKQLMERVIEPKQRQIIEAIEEILVFYGINIDLSFIPLIKPMAPQDEVAKTSLSKELSPSIDMANELISFGETFDDTDWIKLSESEVDYDTDNDIYELIQLATSTGVARPNAKSGQDSKDIVIRYKYVGNPNPQREFCIKMMSASQRGKLYRKEDILQMNRGGVNDGFGKDGKDAYSIWKWKGGGRISTEFPNGTCKHKWNRVVFLKRNGGVDVNSPLAKKISAPNAKARGYKVPQNNKNVSLTPHQNKT